MRSFDVKVISPFRTVTSKNNSCEFVEYSVELKPLDTHVEQRCGAAPADMRPSSCLLSQRGGDSTARNWTPMPVCAMRRTTAMCSAALTTPSLLAECFPCCCRDRALWNICIAQSAPTTRGAGQQRRTTFMWCGWRCSPSWRSCVYTDCRQAACVQIIVVKAR